MPEEPFFKDLIIDLEMFLRGSEKFLNDSEMFLTLSDYFLGVGISFLRDSETFRNH
jgi:hypothetical protein